MFNSFRVCSIKDENGLDIQIQEHELIAEIRKILYQGHSKNLTLKCLREETEEEKRTFSLEKSQE